MPASRYIPTARARSLRHGLFRALAVVLSTVVACILAEGALCVSGYWRHYANPFRSFHEFDPELGVRGRPNLSGRLINREVDVLIEHDAHGFRQSVHRHESSADRGDVFVLGDSFIWGYAVGQGKVVTDRMEDLLEGRQVHNFGLCSAGTLIEYVIFEKYVQSRMRPGDTVVLSFYGNDFNDNVGKDHCGRLHARIRNNEIEVVPPDGTAVPGKLALMLKDGCCLFNLLTYGADRLKDRFASVSKGCTPAAPAISVADPGSQPAVVARARPVLAPIPDDSTEVRVTRHYLAALQRACLAKQVDFVAVYIPLKEELGEREGAENFGESPEREAFLRCTKSLGIATIDLLPFFRHAKRLGKISRVTFQHDFHWNEEGHEAAAQAISEFLTARTATRLLAAVKAE
jgi:hypothetical protein